MKKDYKALADEILDKIGGKENVSSLVHCQTRLRFVLKDESKADAKAVEAIDGVLKVIVNAQFQVVIGTDVKFVYDEIVKQGITAGGEVPDDDIPVKNRKIGDVVLDYMFSIFQPLIPYLIGSGMLKALLSIMGAFGLNNSSSTYSIISSIADAAYYFLPLAVAITTAEKLKCNKLLALACVSALVIPSMTSQLGAGATLFGLPLRNVQYAYQVFPAILCVFLYSFMEKLATKYVPAALQQVLVPLITMIVTVPVTLLLLGPIGITVGDVITNAILWFNSKLGWLATGVLAAILPIMIGTGMHKALVPYTVSTMAAVGCELLYLPASLAHNLGEAGTCLAVAFRTKDPAKRRTALQCLITSLTSVQEPTLYSITMPNRRTLIGTMVGCFFSGCIIGLMGIKAFAVAGPSLTTLPIFIDPNGGNNFVKALIGVAIAIGCCFLSVSIFYKDEEK
ncbi:MAG: PTS transporter subunit EIIC [Erysipelotrichaceae bacterium]|nr:PTS transporter subunit EIIC [Erysipelotrichaceae bacterium]